MGIFGILVHVHVVLLSPVNFIAHHVIGYPTGKVACMHYMLKYHFCSVPILRIL